MKRQLVAEFEIPADRVTVIPFGLNDTIPRSGMTRDTARQQLGIASSERRYCSLVRSRHTGLEYLIQAVECWPKPANESG